jgi:hypothetical protein
MCYSLLVYQTVKIEHRLCVRLFPDIEPKRLVLLYESFDDREYRFLSELYPLLKHSYWFENKFHSWSDHLNQMVRRIA